MEYPVAMDGQDWTDQEDPKAKMGCLGSKALLEKTAFPAGMDSLDRKAGQDTAGPKDPTHTPDRVCQSRRPEDRRVTRARRATPAFQAALASEAEPEIEGCQELPEKSPVGSKANRETLDTQETQVWTVCPVSPVMMDTLV